MLVQFSVENFRSFRSRQVFSLASTSGTEHPQNVHKGSAPGVPSLVTTSAIYGPNASGKTNLVKAIHAMRSIVLDSAKYDNAPDAIPVKFFKLDPEMSSKPTTFELVFVSDGVKFQYGFSANSERIVEEWLYAFPKKMKQTWLERFWDEESKTDKIEIGSLLTSKLGRKEILSSSTKPCSLFLSTAAFLNEPKIANVYSWFSKQLKVFSKHGPSGQYTCSSCNDPKFKNKIVELLKSADLPVTDVIIEEKKFDPKDLPAGIPDEVKNFFSLQFKDEEMITPRFIHQDIRGNGVVFDFEDESDGTQKIFELAGPVIDVLENGRILIVDELNDSLHPKLVEYIVKLFSKSETNPNNAQLVFTTHETSILNQNVLRRDQFWFCKKNRQLETELYSLIEFSPKKDRENIEKNYLDGRYGAVPYISDYFTLRNEEE